MHTSPLTTLLAAIPVGIAGAVAVVMFGSVLADALGGALGLAALLVVIRSSIQLAGDAGDHDTASQPS